MGHKGFGRQWAGHAEQQWHQHGGRRGGPWGGWTPHGLGRPGNPGPPPWVAGLFGLAQGDQQRGPRVRRGDVRVAILDVVHAADTTGEPVNGYQVIQQIAERSGGAWRPSPGSVYPTIQQLEDEGLVVTGDERGRRTVRLTDAGRAYVSERADELAAVWAPFEEPQGDLGDQGERPGRRERRDVDLKPEIGQVMSAVWQIVTSGTDQQRSAAVDILVEARRKLYGVLADGDAAAVDPDTPAAES